jgi:ABC-type dipeptide/oligopeptide/nickel transport system permease component
MAVETTRAPELSGEQFTTIARNIEAEVGKIIVGQRETMRGVLISLLAGGHCLLEGVPGLGNYLVQALSRRDWMVIQNLVLIYGIIFVAINLLVDLSYAWIDPRIRYQ